MRAQFLDKLIKERDALIEEGTDFDRIYKLTNLIFMLKMEDGVNSFGSLLSTVSPTDIMKMGVK